MKIMTIFGTRPEIIRLSLVIKRLDQLCDHILVHTGQNYDNNLSGIFFEELDVRQPDVHMGIQASGFPNQVGQILQHTGEILEEHQPDRLLILGDTNSGLSSIIAARMGIPVYHMEAGNRCYDDRVPEEINRRIIDHCSTVLMPYTYRSKENLVREGIERRRIFVTGNPIFEVLEAYKDQIEASDAVSRMGLKAGEYFLVTMHRAENVDNRDRLANLLQGLELVAERYQQPVIMSLHPRTADKIRSFNLEPQSELIQLVNPLGLLDFVSLEKQARCVISDSGTVQEECCIFRVPNVTIRDVTERPETIECGSNILSGETPEWLRDVVDLVLHAPSNWLPPVEYTEQHVSYTVSKIIMGYHHKL